MIVYQIASAFFSFAAVWGITRYLGSEGYGGIVAIVAASQVAQVLVNWTSTAVVRFGVEEFVETQRIARTFWVRLIILLVNLAAALALAGFWWPPLASWLQLSPDVFWLVLAHFGVTALWLHAQFALQGLKLPVVQAFFQFSERFLIFLGLAGLVLAKDLTSYNVLICYIAAPAVMFSAGVWRMRKYIFHRWTVDAAFVKQMIVYSLPLAPMGLIGYFSGRDIDAVFIAQYLLKSDLGVYAVATQITGIVLQVPTLANHILVPLFISLEKEEQTHRTERYFKHILPTAVLAWGFLCTVAALSGFYVVPVVFGSEFSDSSIPLWILLAASAVNLPVLLGYAALSHAVSRTYISMFAAIFAAAANIVLNMLLIPKFGLVGCALATLAMTFVSMSTFALMFGRSSVASVTWLYWALLPLIAGVVSILLSEHALLSFLVSASLTISVAYWKRTSVLEMLRFFSLWGRREEKIPHG